MSKKYIGRLPSGDGVEVLVEGSKIANVTPLPSCACGLPYILPCLVDSQHNGAMGIPFNDLRGDGAEMRTIGECLLRHGVGRVQATITTFDYDELCLAAKAIRTAVNQDAEMRALVFGILHEGVFISHLDGWRGAHVSEFIRPPNWEMFQRLDDAAEGFVKTVNVAPEEPGGIDFIDKAKAVGKIVAIGHCCPDITTTNEAVKHGADRVIHFGNGAALMIQRHYNPFWGFLDNPGLKLELICDGFHLPPEIIRVAFRQKGREGIIVVSDAHRLSGCKPGPYSEKDGQDVVFEPNGFLHLKDTILLAGASCQLDTCVEVLVNKIGFSFLDAWHQCSVIPAAAQGIKLPALKPGEEATFVMAEWKDNAVKLHRTVFCGNEYLPDK